jgi:hypothetical protein
MKPQPPTQFTMFTPVKPSIVYRNCLDLILFTARLNPDYAPLKKVGTIHFAIFAYIEKDTMKDEAPLAATYLIFESTFDGTWGDYINDFGTLIPWQIDMVWNNCTGYPGVANQPAFYNYLRTNEIAGYTFASYPDATDPDVVRSIDLREAFQQFVAAQKNTTSPSQLQAAWLKFLTDNQQNIA